MKKQRTFGMYVLLIAVLTLACRTLMDEPEPPEEYYPEGYQPVLLEEWPIDGDIQADLDLLPEDFKASVGENYNRKQRLQKAQREKDD